MGQGNSKAELEAVANVKFEDAVILFQNGRHSNAFYLAGYAIECALKACIAKQVAPLTIPDRKFVQAIYTHNYTDLVGLAGLRGELKTKQNEDQLFQANWALASEWSPDMRYESIDKSMANLMLIAVGDADHGVLPWIRTYW
jgi:HEPN domain-containing protein